MTHHQLPDCHVYRIEADGSETHLGWFAEGDGPRVANAEPINTADAACEPHDHRSPAEHYRVAEGYLEAARDHFHDSTRVDRPHTDRDESALACQMLTGMARAHAQLATAAAVAMPTVARYMGDSTTITDLAHAIGWPLHRPQVSYEEPMRA